MRAARQLVATVCVFAVNPTALQGETHGLAVVDRTVNPAVYVPNDISIKVGDTVRWTNGAGGSFHDVTADDLSWASPQGAGFVYERTFDTVAEVKYHCAYHDPNDEDGTHHGVIQVTAQTVDLNPGHNGNWWAGSSRNGEGVQVEVSNSANGGQVLVATMYSYDPTGQPIFLLAVGSVANDEADVAVYIYEGPNWGAEFDPADLVETEWGTGLFKSSSCSSLSMSLTPNPTYVAQGYTQLSYELTRLTNSAIPCPL